MLHRIKNKKVDYEGNQDEGSNSASVRSGGSRRRLANLALGVFKYDPYMFMCDISRVHRRPEYKHRKPNDRYLTHPGLFIEKCHQEKRRIALLVLLVMHQTYSLVKFGLSAFFQINYHRSWNETDHEYWFKMGESIGNPMIAIGDFGIYLSLGSLQACHVLIVLLPLYFMLCRPLEAPHIRFLLDPSREIARLDHNIRDILDDTSNSIHHYRENLKLRHYYCCETSDSPNLKHRLVFDELDETSRKIDFYRQNLHILRPEVMKDDTVSHAKVLQELPATFFFVAGGFPIFSVFIQTSIVHLAIQGKCELLKRDRCGISTAWTRADVLMQIEASVYALLASWISALCLSVSSLASINQQQIIKCTRNQLLQCLRPLRNSNYSRSTNLQRKGPINSNLKTIHKICRGTMLKTLLKFKIHLSEYKRLTECISLLISTYFVVAAGFLAISVPATYISRDQNNFYTKVMLFVVWFSLNLTCLASAVIHCSLVNLDKLCWSIVGENLIRLDNEKAAPSEDFVTSLWFKLVYSTRRELTFCASRAFKLKLTHEYIIQVNLLLFTAVSVIRS